MRVFRYVLAQVLSGPLTNNLQQHSMWFMSAKWITYFGSDLQSNYFASKADTKVTPLLYSSTSSAEQMKAYLSSSVNPETHEKNKPITDYFEGKLKEISLPVELESKMLHVPKEKLPRVIATKCKSLILQADFVILNAGHYGKDSSCEVGYAKGLGKSILAFVGNEKALTKLREDWIVKSMVDAIIVPHKEVESLKERIKEDNMLDARPFIPIGNQTDSWERIERIITRARDDS
jgi:nucleoside 2-deoxyribosyltransferase